jgi:hypothetical protein
MSDLQDIIRKKLQKDGFTTDSEIFKDDRDVIAGFDIIKNLPDTPTEEQEIEIEENKE